MSADKKGIGRRIREARQARSMSQAELAAKIGEGRRGVISEWENGVSAPGATKIGLVAAALEVTPNYLLDFWGGQTTELSFMDGERLRKLHALDANGVETVDAVLNLQYERCIDQQAQVTQPTALIRPIRFVPLPVSAGTGVMLDDEQTEAIDIPLTPESRQADFVLRVSGDSMEPEFHDGDLLLIQQTDVVEEGELGVFAVNNEGFFKRAGRGQLESLNPAYAPIRLCDGDSVTTFGRVLGTTERVSGE